MKPGIKSTEFWLTLATAGFIAANQAGLFPQDNPWVQLGSSLCAALVAMGYTHSRGKVKSQPQVEILEVEE